jgi:hypothetical protein
MHRQAPPLLSTILFALLSATSATAHALPTRGATPEVIGHASGCFRVDATRCCHAGPDRYHCH